MAFKALTQEFSRFQEIFANNTYKEFSPYGGNL